ncbi:hypothetical protein OOK60_15590 [Trichothermofontia sichuanensis B231]|uniref:DUF6825 family protein n=1 Tax=Trichothermofontia sichuanensis TaxID=3045816 RepID=UPI00224787DB|nr:hypothetical protein [Trichothermofontia sichuanensis]UZQ53896.1 hypothetical protein OOK60_15590 [Trichothermofontia sichuanensis B231]
MSNSLIHAFFVGRAIAETITEQVEATLTNAISTLGKFDAEQRERLRQLTDEVLERAKREEDLALQGRSGLGTAGATTAPTDLQTTIDELRAEIAQVRSALQQYRNSA